MRLASIIRMRLESLFWRTVVERELDEELQYHLDRQIEENLAAGMGPQEARWAALRSISGFEQRKEECRDQRGLNMFDNLINDIRFALRQLRKDLEFTATAILMLALGICASVTIFAFVDAALLKPLPYKDSARLLGVYEKIDPWCPRCDLSWPDYLDWKKQSSTTMSSLDVYQVTDYAMTTPSGLKPVFAARVSDGFFRTLGVIPAVGRDFYAGEDQPSAPRTIILSYSAWQKRFGGDPNVLGQTVVLDRVPNVIVGVLPKAFHFAPAGGAEFWRPFHAENGCDTSRGCHALYGVGRLKDGVSMEAALANFVSIARQLEKQYTSNRNQGANVAPLTDVIAGEIRPILLVMLGGAGLLLLIASVNVVGLLLVRSESRKREMAVRTALGASSGRLAGQFATEALLLIGASGAIGVISASWLMQILVKFRSEDIAARTPFLEDVGLNFRVMAFAGAIAVLAAVLFSIAPGLRIWPPEIRAGLAEGSRGSAGTVWRRLGSKLVVLELATAMVLLVGAGLLGKSLDRLLSVDLGFVPDHLVTMQVAASDEKYGKDPEAIALVRRLMNRLENVPGVKAAGIAANGLPLGDNGNTTWIRVLGRPWNGEHLEIPVRYVSPSYFNTLAAKLGRGRYFDESEDGSKPPVAIINRAFARVHFPNEDAVGKQLSRLSPPPEPIEIVGIIEDIREGPLEAEVPPVLYRPFNQRTKTTLNVVVRTSQDAGSLEKTLAAAIQGIDPELVLAGNRTMNDRIRESPSAYLHRSAASLVGGFAGLALLMGLIGLYGVIAYSVSQRTREIGVRMALGAVPGTVYQLILKEAGWLTLMGIAAGLVCSIAAANLMRGLLFRVNPWDVPTLGAIAGMLGVLALVASFIPARRAASVNPIEALRAE